MNHAKNQYTATLETLTGETVEVTYHLPALRALADYVDWEQDEPVLAEKLTGNDEGWADQFTDVSLYAFADQVRDEMSPRVAAWMERQAAKIAKLRAVNAMLTGNNQTGIPSSPEESS